MNAGPVCEASVWQPWQNITYVSFPRLAWAVLNTPLSVVRAALSALDAVCARGAPIAARDAARSTLEARMRLSEKGNVCRGRIPSKIGIGRGSDQRPGTFDRSVALLAGSALDR
jgi:hypothetical protein